MFHVWDFERRRAEKKTSTTRPIHVDDDDE